MSQVKLYQVRLAARVEVLRDLTETLARFQASYRDDATNEERDQAHGFVGRLAYEQAELIAGVYVPDYDITDLTLRVYVEEGDDAVRALSAVVKRFVDCAQEVRDTHVLRESLDFQDRYTGERDGNKIAFTEEGVLVGLDERIECLSM